MPGWFVAGHLFETLIGMSSGLSQRNRIAIRKTLIVIRPEITADCNGAGNVRKAGFAYC